jgi:hypothetical protein
MTDFGDAATAMSEAMEGGDQRLEGSDRVVQDIIGDAPDLLDLAHGGNDTLLAGSDGAVTFAYGDAYGLSGHASGGDDHLVGGSEAINRLAGDGASMGGNAVGGDDLVVAGGVGSTNFLYGDAIEMWDATYGGDDTIIGGAGTDRMFGDAAYAGGGHGGSDLFVFAPGGGEDQIGDFESGKDHIDLTVFGPDGLHGTGDLDFASGESGLVIGLPDGGSITVLGRHCLGESDFVFS